LIMRLNEIGLDASVRYNRYEDGVRLAEIDVVKAVTASPPNSKYPCKFTFCKLDKNLQVHILQT
jgi:hypothetical protein